MIRIKAPGMPPIAQTKRLKILISILVIPIAFAIKNKTTPRTAFTANSISDLTILKAIIRHITAMIRRAILTITLLVFVY